MTHSVPLILAADIGGTNTRLALLEGTQLRSETVQRFVNAQTESLESMLATYLGAHACRPDAIALALAGPVDGDTGQLTNLDWTITTTSASAAAGGAPAVLLNDLQAQGHALPFITSEAVTQILPGVPADAEAPCLMIGVGTGMNVAPVHVQGNARYVPPSEAGHSDYAPQDAEQIAFKELLRSTLGHVAAEDVLSGRGVEAAYHFTSGARAHAAEVMAKAQAGDAEALRAAHLIIRALAYFAADMALVHLPFGGIYLVGGVARALAPHFETADLARCFHDKGRFSDYMHRFALRVLQDDYAALTGAASFARQELARAGAH